MSDIFDTWAAQAQETEKNIDFEEKQQEVFEPVADLLDSDGNIIGESTATHKRLESAPVETSMAVVQITPDVAETDAFNKILAEIPEKLKQVDTLLTDWRKNPDEFVETIDEESLNENLKALDAISSFSTSITNDRKAIKDYFNDQRDKAVKYLDDKLTAAKFDDLVTAKADINQLKNDITAHRANQRWAELKSTFEASIAQYNIIARLAPELQDFSRFRLINPKLVSGAKTRKITEKVRTNVSNIVFEWSTALQSIESNSWGLSSADQFKLLNGFKANPSPQYVITEGEALKINAERKLEAERRAAELREKAEAEAKIKREQEAKEMARIKQQQEDAQRRRDTEAQAKADAEAKALAEKMEQARKAEEARKKEIEELSNLYVKPQVKQEFPKFVDYMFGIPAYKDVHTNPRTKARLAYDTMMQVATSGSVVQLETGGDPEKVLDLLRFILDV